jgi:hypothetical protein
MLVQTGPLFGKQNTYSIHCPSWIHPTSSVMGQIRPDFSRSHPPHSSSPLDGREFEMRHLIIFVDQAGDIVYTGRHFNSAPESFTFPVLPRIVGG